MAHEEGTGHIDGYHEKEEELVTFEFPIREVGGETQMKNIPPSTLPNFCGVSSEDPDAFLFEFIVFCRSYDNYSNSQKLKLFPAILKDENIRWFMGLASNSIRIWDEMKKVFLKKYQDYCKTRDLKEEIFGMTQKEWDCLEDLVERFQYNIQISKMNQLSKDTKKTILLIAIKLGSLEIWNLVGGCEISKLDYDEVCEICWQYSRGARVTRAEMGYLFENLKIDILSMLSSELDFFRLRRNRKNRSNWRRSWPCFVQNVGRSMP